MLPLAAFLKQRAQSRGIFIYGYSPGMPACASRHAGTLGQPRGFCCLPINRLFRSAADSAALLIFSAHADFEDAPILFSLLFTAVSTRHLRHRNFRYRHLHFRSGSFPYSIRLPVPFRPPCLFVQLAGLTSDIAKGALLFSLSASVFFSATHRASDFRHTKMPQADACGIFLEVPTRFELVHRGFADLCLTTWLRHHMQIPPP